MKTHSLLLGLLALAVFASCTSTPDLPAGVCLFDADCTAPLRCVAHACRAPCRADADCGPNQVCTGGDVSGVRICTARMGERPCVYSTECGDGSICTRDGVCRPQCRESYDCMVINPHLTCMTGACVLVCRDGTANCDGDLRNGCEADLSASTSCGACGVRCAAGQICARQADGRHACTNEACPPDRPVTCGGVCTDVNANPMHCGACGNACAARANASSTCTGGRCAVTCNAGFGDCDGNAANGCETDLNASPAHCGGCGMACNATNGTAACSAGRCGVTCSAGFGNCDGDVANGCETSTATTAEHCGGCGMACSLPNATATCAGGRCGVAACTPTRGDCDRDSVNGCEVDLSASVTHCGMCGTQCPAGWFCLRGACARDCGTLAVCSGACADLQTSTTHCGRCGNACTFPNGVAACNAGVCALARCNAGFGDCDGNAANGCETSLNTATAHCGACGAACNATNGTATCAAGRCAITCGAGFGNCDGDVANGCETSTSASASHCGGCGRACSLPNATPACSGGTCSIAACAAGFADCNRTASDGCETSTNASAAHCGGCGMACALPNATAACSTGACVIARCNAGFGDCDGNAANGCETDLRASAARCGSCGAACSLPRATPRCAAGVCAVASCEAGFGDCDGNAANGCETNVLTSTAHCMTCGRACAAGQVCSNGACSNICTPPTTFCAGRCVNLQTDPTSCGTCGTACPARPNATPACTRGACGYTCTMGFGDCDGNAANGCETDLNASPAHCGGCGAACNATNGTAACARGACSITCAAGFGNCDGSVANGCEVNLNATVAHCGSCGATCSLPNATPACAAGMCAVGACNAGFGNCDGVAANGCETNLNVTPAHCGMCRNACSSINGTASCAAGTCGIICTRGFGNCDGMASNGCETNTGTTVSHCGACGNACSLPNATAACAGGACAVAACTAGFGNCDTVASNGCEANLNTSPAHCGGCGRACPTGFFCNAGTCARDCMGLTNCSNTCVNLQTDTSHCGACGRACSFPNATPACATGTCAIGSCNAGFGNCDGMLANGCETSTSTTVSHCGMCGNACSFANASAGCVSGRCVLGACSAGFANCDGVASNGCEANLGSSTAHCGMCGVACNAPTNGSVACVSGACRQSCNPGYYSIPLGSTILCAPIPAPRQVAPSSFGWATRPTPEFRWVHQGPTNGARLQVCATRACTTALLDVSVAGTTYTPTAPLPAGRLYWRLFGQIGTNTGANPSPAWQVHVSPRAATRNAAFGVTPDFNGDGFADFAVNDLYAPTPAVRIFYGSAGGLPSTASASLAGTSSTGFGLAVSPAGDVNGDGYGDLVVGAPNINTAYVYLGSPAGLTSRVTLSGNTGSGFGGSASWAGDTNDDGYGDVVIGACNNPTPCEGAAYVFHGTSSGVTTPAARRLTVAGVAGFGRHVQGVGEVNGDTFDDIVVGSPTGVYQFSGTSTTSNFSFQVAGMTDLDFAWDVNGDGHGDLAVTAAVNTTAVTRVLRVYYGGANGLNSSTPTVVSLPVRANGPLVAGLGDTDGDGFSDVAWSLIGDWVRVHRGSAAGLSTTHSVMVSPVPGDSDFGWELWHAGDVDGNNRWDLIYEATNTSPCRRVIRYHRATTGVQTAATSTIYLPLTCIF